ncbi:hypothetical protein [Deinococcus wulumuqiensis]|uniref:hypothetical protein n=1 Tax=Deinococcus wulumuqiensis TaxID=980427 RepID=UPI0024304196|nr:hypothetical protein [Deinococcus wulumuqiensis]
MNQMVNFSGGGLSFGVLAAGLIFAFGLWRGREDLAKRAARDVLLATILTSLVGMLPFLWLTSLNFNRGIPSAPLLGIVWTVVVTLLNFVPLAVAARWMEQIRRQD